MRSVVERFYNWVVETLEKLFSKKEIAEADAGSIKNIEIHESNSYIIKEAEKTKSLLEKCKTPKELERVMVAYRKKVARQKALRKIGATIIIVSAVAMVAWLHHTKKVEIEKYKKEQKDASNKLAKLETQLLDERSAAAKERSKLRQEVETANAKTLSMCKEVEKMKIDAEKARRSGQLQGAMELQKAKVEVVRDQVNAIVDQTKDVVSALSSSEKSDGEKISKVINAPKNIAKATLAASENKTAELKDKNREVAKIGTQVKKNIDRAISVLDSDTVDLDKRKHALDYLLRNEPVIQQLGGNYAVRAKGIISRENSERNRRINIANDAKPLSIGTVFGKTALDNINKAVTVLDSPVSSAGSKQKAKSYLQKHINALRTVKNDPVARKALRLIR